MLDNYQIKKATLLGILRERLRIAQAKLTERRAMWNKEFDGLKRAQGIDRRIGGFIAPLSLLFRKKGVKEEDRAAWVQEMYDKDMSIRLVKTDVLILDGTIKALESDKYTLTDIENKLAEM